MDDLSGSSFEVGWSMYCGRLTDLDDTDLDDTDLDDVGSETGRGVSLNWVR
jgi:hypothetical protein